VFSLFSLFCPNPSVNTKGFDPPWWRYRAPYRRVRNHAEWQSESKIPNDKNRKILFRWDSRDCFIVSVQIWMMKT
jgi:hypothetical protein